MALTKRFMAGTLCCAGLAACLAGCGSSTADTAATDTQAAETEAAETQDQTAQSDYAVTIDSARVVQDYEGKDAVAITYTFTNNSDEAQSFMVACTEDVYQNGVELDLAVVDGVDSSASMNKVKPGASIQVEEAYVLQDMSPVDVEVYELFSLDNTMIAQKEFTLE
jgi:copper(I)-binding protein